MKKLLLILAVLPVSLFAQVFNYLPTSTTNQIVRHTYYTLSYSEEHEQAEWVAYELTKDRVYGTSGRTDNFREDRKVGTGSASLNDYKRSGYDRGHLVPAGDMNFSSTAMSESFYMSNISPQHPSFNRGIWKNLESQVRSWALKNDHIYVITGGILNSSSDAIGANSVTVPDYYYKVVFDYTEPKIKMIAFLIPNQKCEKNLNQYVCSIDYLESITGVDFFPELEDDLENKLENKLIVKGRWSWDSTGDVQDLKNEAIKTLNKFKRH